MNKERISKTPKKKKKTIEDNFKEIVAVSCRFCRLCFSRFVLCFRIQRSAFRVGPTLNALACSGPLDWAHDLDLLSLSDTSQLQIPNFWVRIQIGISYMF